MRLITLLLTITLYLSSNTSIAQSDSTITIPLQKNEKVWAGVIGMGHLMPFSADFTYNLYGENDNNQIQPLILTNQGRLIWSEQPFEFTVDDNKIEVSKAYGKIITEQKGNSLREAQTYAQETFFPSKQQTPDTLLFARPQYNTWIELTYNQNQKDILKYAQAIIDNGLPPGVIMIDDTWQEDYGLWKFHPGRFPDPKSMVDQLHQMGFKVMVWVCPFVSADQYLIYNDLRNKKAFLLEKENPNMTWQEASLPAMVRWWNGVSAELDFSNPEALKWFKEQLSRLQSDYGIDGFKFDAGDFKFYPSNTLNMQNLNPNEQAELYNKIGLDYPLNEYRAAWKMGGEPLAQRLADKNHSWEDLNKLIPQMITQNLMGYTFACPDMIGGGEFKSFLDLTKIDQELVVRSAQCHALMGMMQFSVAPWRILDKDHLEAVKKAVATRMEFTPEIMKLVEHSRKTGEPIVCNLEYYFPDNDLADVKDQFMLGENIMVAPMLKKGNKRDILLPPGRWKDDLGKIHKGKRTIKASVPLNRLPYFIKVK